MNAREHAYAALAATRPRVAPAAWPADAFIARFMAQKGVCARLEGDSAVAAYIARAFPGCDTVQLAGDDALAAIDWRAAGLRVVEPTPRAGCALAVTTALCAVAETGSVLLHPRAGAPMAMNLLPDRLVVLLREADIVAGLEEFWGVVRSRFGATPPRALCLVSGPSTSGDVEMHFATGVHGPIEVHALLLR